MSIVITGLVVLIAALHIYFLVLEMFLWTKPMGLKIFRHSSEKARETAVLGANQGLYNGFLAAGLLWGVFYPSARIGLQIEIFFLICVLIAGLYGAYSVSKKILFIQAAPAALALLLILVSPTKTRSVGPIELDGDTKVELPKFKFNN